MDFLNTDFDYENCIKCIPVNKSSFAILVWFLAC